MRPRFQWKQPNPPSPGDWKPFPWLLLFITILLSALLYFLKIPPFHEL